MMINLLFQLIIIIFAVMIQVSFLTTWPSPINNLNLILSLMVFVTVVVNYEKGLWWAFGSGLLLEFYSGLFFGTIVLSLLLTVILINFLFNNFFTNRSFYSLLILGFIATLSYHLIIVIFQLVGFLIGFEFSPISFNFWQWFFWRPFLNLLILAVIFLTYQISTNRLKNFFVLSR